jgi:hypothetical protein
MVALVLEIYGAFCFFSLIAFLVLASVAKLRPDLDEEIHELEKLKKLVSSEQLGNALPVEELINKDPSRPAPSRTVEQSKRRIPRRPHLIHLRKPRII